MWKVEIRIFGMFLFFLQNYLSSRGKSWKDLRQEALQNMEQGKYFPTGNPACLIIWKLHMQQRWGTEPVLLCL